MSELNKLLTNMAETQHKLVQGQNMMSEEIMRQKQVIEEHEAVLRGALDLIKALTAEIEQLKSAKIWIPN